MISRTDYGLQIHQGSAGMGGVESKSMAMAFSKTGTLYDAPLTCDGNEVDTTIVHPERSLQYLGFIKVKTASWGPFRRKPRQWVPPRATPSSQLPPHYKLAEKSLIVRKGRQEFLSQPTPTPHRFKNGQEEVSHLVIILHSMWQRIGPE